MTKEEIAELIEQMPQDMDANDYIHELVNRAVEVEREACAKVCDRMAQRTQDIRSAALESAAENIRARGEK
jgi:gamma-glutamyl:cysteine ligase YbdK (ATP-grasp superfamily)